MNWLTALSNLQRDSEAHVLLTVLDIRGSSPRDVGTKMVVSIDKIFDTIGGGALEHQAIEIARELLSENLQSQHSPQDNSQHSSQHSTQHSAQQKTQHTQTFNLGKDLKQCCGGVVSIFFEVFPVSNFSINIFGAGHIGQAFTKVLGDIDCHVNLFDSRDELFQENYPEHIKTHSLDKPELAVEACNANSYFLVMTHDHALDQQLCEAILARGDSLYCGVIGSRTKSIKFNQRLKRKGFSTEELSQLNCPMGLIDLKTKMPMEIAISVIAELLILRNKHQFASNIIHSEKKYSKDSEDTKIIRLENREQ